MSKNKAQKDGPLAGKRKYSGPMNWLVTQGKPCHVSAAALPKLLPAEVESDLATSTKCTAATATARAHMQACACAHSAPQK